MPFGPFGGRKKEDGGPDEEILELVARATMKGEFWLELIRTCFMAMEEKGEAERAMQITNRILDVLAKEDVCLGTSIMSLFSAITFMIAGAVELNHSMKRLVGKFAEGGNRKEEEERTDTGRMIWFIGDADVPEV